MLHPFAWISIPSRAAFRGTRWARVPMIVFAGVIGLQACGDSPSELPKAGPVPAPPPQFASISVSPATLTMVPFEGLDTVTFAVTAFNQNGQQMSPGGQPAFASLNPNVVQVNGGGSVTAQAVGTTGITITWLAGDVTQTANVPVTVVDNVEEAMVGTWQGPISGTWLNGLQQTSTITATLFADGALSGTGVAGSLFACAVAGTWQITGTDLATTAQEVACNGTVITSKAPLSTTRLVGTWTASSGATGTFSYTKK
jgi:hypothetical protein